MFHVMLDLLSVFLGLRYCETKVRTALASDLAKPKMKICFQA